MIVKGNQRGGGQNLATHLMNSLDNERVEVAEVRGAVAADLHGAFAEWFAASKATNCRKYLYSLSVSPDQRQRRLSRQQYIDFITRTEKKLKLQDNSRVIVFHVKNGREHCHIVWSRIDTDRMKAVQLSHDRQKLRMICRAFARDHGLELPDGMKRDRGKDRHKARDSHSGLAEKQQEERTGITKEERKRDIGEAWRSSDSGASFIKNLQERGYQLARGDRRSYVVVDPFGEVHSLSRQLPPGSGKALKFVLIDYPPEKLPPVQIARHYVQQWREERLKSIQNQIEGPSPEQQREDLRNGHAQRRAKLDRKRDALLHHQRSERTALAARHHHAEKEVVERRRAVAPRGLLAFLGKITGINALLAHRHKKQDSRRAEIHRAELSALDRSHQRERTEFQRHYRSLARVEKREIQSLESAIRRKAFQQAVHRSVGKEVTQTRPTEKRRDVTKTTFNRSDAVPTKPSPPFNQAARTQSPPANLGRNFNDAGRPPGASQEAGTTKGTEQRPRDTFADAVLNQAKNIPQETPRKPDGLERHFDQATRKEPANTETKQRSRAPRRSGDRDFER